ncbi:MAG: DNA replication protein [Rhodospirillaceae bacterium]|nr:DNA replication protein [Rhodospirillaceae bacterium]
MPELHQKIFDFAARPSLGGEDYFVGPSNQDAVAWLDKWPDWSGPALIIHGPAGCGKSHIASVQLARSAGVLVTPALLKQVGLPEILESASHYVVDDADSGFEEEDLLHLYNGLAAAGGTLLLTAKVSPARWNSQLKDLDSRLKAAASVAIGQPDDDLLKAVLAKQFSDRQLLVDQEVISYAAKRMERSLAEVRTIVDGADKLSLVKGHKVTMPLIRDVLAIGSAG